MNPSRLRFLQRHSALYDSRAGVRHISNTTRRVFRQHRDFGLREDSETSRGCPRHFRTRPCLLPAHLANLMLARAGGSRRHITSGARWEPRVANDSLSCFLKACFLSQWLARICGLFRAFARAPAVGFPLHAQIQIFLALGMDWPAGFHGLCARCDDCTPSGVAPAVLPTRAESLPRCCNPASSECLEAASASVSGAFWSFRRKWRFSVSCDRAGLLFVRACAT